MSTKKRTRAGFTNAPSLLPLPLSTTTSTQPLPSTTPQIAQHTQKKRRAGGIANTCASLLPPPAIVDTRKRVVPHSQPTPSTQATRKPRPGFANASSLVPFPTSSNTQPASPNAPAPRMTKRPPSQPISTPPKPKRTAGLANTPSLLPFASSPSAIAQSQPTPVIPSTQSSQPTRTQPIRKRNAGFANVPSPLPFASSSGSRADTSTVPNSQTMLKLHAQPAPSTSIQPTRKRKAAGFTNAPSLLQPPPSSAAVPRQTQSQVTFETGSPNITDTPSTQPIQSQSMTQTLPQSTHAPSYLRDAIPFSSSQRYIRPDEDIRSQPLLSQSFAIYNTLEAKSRNETQSSHKTATQRTQRAPCSVCRTTKFRRVDGRVVCVYGHLVASLETEGEFMEGGRAVRIAKNSQNRQKSLQLLTPSEMTMKHNALKTTVLHALLMSMASSLSDLIGEMRFEDEVEDTWNTYLEHMKTTMQRRKVHTLRQRPLDPMTILYMPVVLSILHLTIMRLRLPILLAEIFNYIWNGSIPYFIPSEYLPPELITALRQDHLLCLQFIPSRLPSPRKVNFVTSCILEAMDICIPPLDIPDICEHLKMPYNIRGMVESILDLSAVNLSFPIRSNTEWLDCIKLRGNVKPCRYVFPEEYIMCAIWKGIIELHESWEPFRYYGRWGHSLKTELASNTNNGVSILENGIYRTSDLDDHALNLVDLLRAENRLPFSDATASVKSLSIITQRAVPPFVAYAGIFGYEAADRQERLERCLALFEAKLNMGV